MDMEYDLLKHRGLQPSDDIPSMKLLYMYGKYKKEREAQPPPSGNVTRTF